MNFRKWLCRLGFHNWSPNYYGVRVCLARGCVRIDLYYGVSGMLRYLRENYTEKEIEEMAAGSFMKSLKEWFWKEKNGTK